MTKIVKKKDADSNDMVTVTVTKYNFEHNIKKYKFRKIIY